MNEGVINLNDEQVNEILEMLKNGQLSEHFVKKEDFLDFRKVLVKRDDFKHFRGIAQRGGDVLYRFSKIPRS